MQHRLKTKGEGKADNRGQEALTPNLEDNMGIKAKVHTRVIVLNGSFFSKGQAHDTYLSSRLFRRAPRRPTPQCRGWCCFEMERDRRQEKFFEKLATCKELQRAG